MEEKTELIITIGLPKSGKSTWARKQNLPIVNPDSIRLALHGKRYEPLAEDMVWAIHFIMIRSLILAGHSKIIVDATHITEKRRTPYKIKFPDCKLTYHTVNTGRAECIRRAEEERDTEIIPIIENMASKIDGLEFPVCDTTGYQENK